MYTDFTSSGWSLNSLLSLRRSVSPPIATCIIWRQERPLRLSLGMSPLPGYSTAVAHVPFHTSAAAEGSASIMAATKMKAVFK